MNDCKISAKRIPMMTSDQALFTIGALAKSTGLTVDTLRYYEKQGLLKPSGRSSTGYRLFSAEAVSQLNFIRQAKAVGFTLKEIQELIALQVSKEADCQAVHAVATLRLQQIKQKIDQLEKMQEGLHMLIERCPAGSHSLDYCTIMNGLNNA